jgi:putative Mg2+ transporter-C (MgtC) family protein
MRTVTLICTGSSVFTMVSIFMSQAASADPGRIAAQVVTGIGFLGAGTILHTRGQVKGLTTAATIWVVAAIGVLIGAGYAVPGVVMSLFVFGLLQMHSEAEDGAEPESPEGERHRRPGGPTVPQ